MLIAHCKFVAYLYENTSQPEWNQVWSDANSRGDMGFGRGGNLGARSDYIVPEAPASRRHGRAPLLLAAILVAILVWAITALNPDVLNPAGPEVSLLDDQAATRSAGNTLLRDLAPIGVANAMAPAPVVPEMLPEMEPADLPAIPLSPPTGESLAAAPVADDPAPPFEELTVRKGDSLSTLFARHQLRAADWIALSKLDGAARRLNRLQPGDVVHLLRNGDGHVDHLKLRLDSLTSLEIKRGADGKFASQVLAAAVEYREVVAQGEIENSLFLSARDAGLSDRLIMEFADILAWDVDFALDIRQGDRFTVVYQEIYRDGEKIKDGEILAGEFHNRDRVIRAVRYADESGRASYYSPEGQPMQKAFLRSPVEFTRISSRFSLGRKHPILNRIRAHRGVDYAAGRGTPIKAAGAGKVIFAGRKGGYGNVLILQHAGKYTTLYAHMDSFRRGIHRGVSVNQGQTIGYVGSTGLATGPHLHYEFRVNDQHVDPLKVKLPESPKIATDKLPRFKELTAPLVARLDEINNQTIVADSGQ